MGVGISAGGLEPLGQVLTSLGDAPGLAVVVIPHLDPSHESHLVPLMAKRTSMTVLAIESGMEVQPNHVYVLPPNATVVIKGTRLQVSAREESRAPPHPIDLFFRSLADEWDVCGIGVVLSGALDDGTNGLRHIRSAGGFTLAQDPETAEYKGMPESAIAAGAVDLVLSPAEIGAEVVRLASAPYVHVGTGTIQPGDGDATALDRVFETLRARTGMDFSEYKRSTVLRRIDRRMTALRAPNLEAYAQILRQLPDEASILRNDLLINVTRFFREWEGVASLDELIEQMVNTHGNDEPIRIWSAGCATGEEAYTLAIAVMEFLRRGDRSAKLQVFGTDVNDAAIDVARRGYYPPSIVDDVPADVLSRYFERTGNGYTVNRALRAACVFAVHDLSRDPPFSRMDLVSCRNVLIYMQPTLQHRVLAQLHYALNPRGHLIVGSAEAIGRFESMFKPLNKKEHIFRKTGSPPVAAARGRSAGAPVGERVRSGQPTMAHGEMEVRHAVDRILLARFAPPAVLINNSLDVVEFRNDMSPYLVHGPGPATLNLMRSLRDGLAADARNLIRATRASQKVERRLAVEVRDPRRPSLVDIEVMPVTGHNVPEGYLLVTFQPHGEQGPRLDSDAVSVDVWSLQEVSKVERLERELEASREYLKAVVEDYEATNEELQSANEEAMSTNEELQSTNEELQTAKEEHESTNEELTTLNEELVSRSDEVRKISSDLMNLLNSVNIPIVMLAPDLSIRRFTSAARREFKLIPTDIGRPLSDIALPFDDQGLANDIRAVSETLQRRVVHLRDREDGTWIIEIAPYRTIDDRIDGAVLVARRAGASDEA